MSGSVESDKGTNPMDATDKKDGDEEVDSVSGSVGQESHKQEFSDPAILAVGTVPAPAAVTQFRYTREELLKLRTAPSSRIRPDFLDAAYFNNQGVWDPEPWHYNRNPDSSTENGGGGRGGEYEGNHKRRSGDPKERIRKEQDGIVLSPQRRSFNSGCFVPVREPLRPNRPHSPLGGGSSGGGSNGSSLKSTDPAHIGSNHRELNSGPGARRIGSGRILPWDFQEKSDVDNDFGYRRDRRETDRDDRFERRSFARDFEIPKEKERHIGRSSNNNGRFSNRRISNESKEEEPEWFSSGPMSQNDTIELRGFDDNEKLGGVGPGSSKKKTAAQKKKLKEQQAAKAKETTGGSDKNYLNEDSINKKTASEQIRSNVPTTTVQEPTVNIEVARVSPQKPEQGGGGDGPHVMPSISSNEASFNFEDILKCDNFPGLLSNGVESGDAAGSRFSRWFQREKSPPQPKLTDGSRRSSLQDHDHHHIIKNLLSDPFNEPSVSIPQPGDSESYFAPISPAASSILPQQQAKGVNLMEMLQRNNKHAGGPPSQIHPEGAPPPLKSIVDVPGPGKILSLEELEARMMQGLDMANGKHQPKSENDINAFKRLVNTGGMNHHMTNGPTAVPPKPMSIMEMLSHSQQQDEAARLAASQRIGPAAAANLPHIAEMSFKLQQVQNQVQQQKQQAQIDMLQKLMSLNLAQQQATRASPLQEMGINQSRELLNRPEAQAILQGLKRGDLTPQHLYQQLANPAMQPRHRDLLLTILKMQVASGGMPQSASPVPPPHHIYQQQLRVSPLPPNAMHQRIPSPRELQVHTQNIMQRALIKKKLEEQEENFRKKQAQQRGTSPAKTASPTPLAFTPTAVLRKMTADKDDGSKDVKGDSKLPQGRPVTGMRTAQPSQQQPQVTSQQSQSWNTQFPQQLKQPGRPIVKANNYQPPTQTQQQQQEQYFQQQRLLQQQRKNQQHQQQSFGTTFSPQGQQQQQFPQLSQQQLRAQHQNVRSQHQQQQPFGQQQQQQSSWTQQMLQGQGFDNRQVGRGGIDGDLSPTSNQLARWFSPDLLDRARKGKVPVIPSSAVTQHALNLEEMDRQTTPVGHN